MDLQPANSPNQKDEETDLHKTVRELNAVLKLFTFDLNNSIKSLHHDVLSTKEMFEDKVRILS